MAEPTQNERSQDVDGLAAAARDRGMEHLEGAKGQLAEGAERVAAAVERTADELDGDGDSALSGFGHSVASLMRQLAGGLRERDIEEFSRELAALARRNPGVFLAGSVALGFGIARFFKAHAPRAERGDDNRWQESGEWRNDAERASGPSKDFDGDDSLDLSAGSPRDAGGDEGWGNSASGDGAQRDAATDGGDAAADTDTTPDDDERDQAKARSSGKQGKRGGKS